MAGNLNIKIDCKRNWVFYILFDWEWGEESENVLTIKIGSERRKLQNLEKVKLLKLFNVGLTAAISVVRFVTGNTVNTNAVIT